MLTEEDKSRKISNSIIAILFMLVSIIIFVLVAPSKYKELFKSIKAGKFNNDFAVTFENSLNTSFPHKNYLIDVNGLAHRVFFQREMNRVLLMKNGMETEPIPDVLDSGIAVNADSIKNLSDWLGNRGIKFLYCQVPWKIDDENNLLPAGKIDYSNRIADEFVKNLKNRKVNYLDLRECIRNDGMERAALFLRTEHHWSSYGGFYAFAKICEYLRNNFGEEIPKYITNIDNYEQVTYQNSSLGYYGQRTGWMFGGFDDFTLIYPSWETRQRSWAPHKKLLREGGFYEAIFYTEYFSKPWRERGLYGTYIGGDWPVVEHHSETAPVDKTIMILIDSFGTIPESFLTTAYKTVIGIDLRWVLRNQIGKTTVQFIEEYNPDIVVVSFNPNQIGYPESEQFQYGVVKTTIPN